MIIIFKTNVGTAAYDSDTILNLEYDPDIKELEIYYIPKTNINVNGCVVKKHHYLKNNIEFDKILEQWKQSKEKK
jgi:hypothetical protein